MRVAVDAEETTCIEGNLDQIVRRVLPFRAGVDFHRDVVLGAGLEDPDGVELGLRALSPRPLHQAPGAVAEDVGVRVVDATQHAFGHGAPVCPEF